MHRPELGGHLAGGVVQDLRTDDVVGHEVGRALDAVEGARDSGGQGLGGGGLGQAGHGFQQDVTAREERGRQRQAQALLAHHALREGVGHAAEEPGGALDVRLGRGVGTGGALRPARECLVAGQGGRGSGIGGAGRVGGQTTGSHGLGRLGRMSGLGRLGGSRPAPAAGGRLGYWWHCRPRGFRRRRRRPGSDRWRHAGLTALVAVGSHMAVGLHWLVAHETPRAPEG